VGENRTIHSFLVGTGRKIEAHLGREGGVEKLLERRFNQTEGKARRTQKEERPSKVSVSKGGGGSKRSF